MHVGSPPPASAAAAAPGVSGAQARQRGYVRHLAAPAAALTPWRGRAQTRQRAYVKDLDFSFHPFLPILGTGLVTADGPLWQRQRLLIGTALRVDILDDVVRHCFNLAYSSLRASHVCRMRWAERGALLQNTARMPSWSARTYFIAALHQKQAPSWRLLGGGRASQCARRGWLSPWRA